MVASSKEFGEDPVKIPRNNATVPRYFVKERRKEMERKPLTKNTVQVTVEKPTSNNWSDILTYLAKIIDPKEIPNYTTLIGLASYSRSNNGLTPKQTKIAEDLVRYAKDRGLL